MKKENFIERARIIHGNKYDYSKVRYLNNRTKICIICPIHGEFYQTPKDHLNGSACPKCHYEKISVLMHSNTKDFIQKAIEIHGNKYDYSKVEYIDSKTKVCIICKEHGEFWQTPNNHLSKKQGCPKCSKNKKLTTNDFIQRAVKIYGNEYIYSNVNYKNAHTKVCVICPTHGEFWVTPDNHLNGSACPKCKSSKLEKIIRTFLLDKNIIFEEQKRFDWLNKQTLDFYLPQYNIGIECQGIQHFEKREFFEDIEVIKNRDNIKRILCDKNGIKLFYYSNLGLNYPYYVYENKEELLKEIITSYGKKEIK